MKLSLALLSSTLSLSNAKSIRTPQADVSATSKMGQKLLSKARRLQNDDENGEIDFTWVANMSLKFQGCHTTQTWNAEANGDQDVKISNQALVRFRLCPSDTCSMSSPYGCSEGYGDYIIDMDTYLQTYLEAVQREREYSCEYEKENGECMCNGENADDGFDEQICEYECFMSKGMEYCVDRNPYAEEGEEDDNEEWNDLQRLAECQQYDFNVEYDNEGGEQNEFFMGAYCSSDGGSIHLGIFTDDTCTNFADNAGGRQIYNELKNGKTLPYSTTTLVGTECMPCKESQDANENDQQDEDEVNESCEVLYEDAGKCEAGLEIAYPNTYACSYMEGIQIERRSGATVMGAASKSTTASVFIGLFVATFVGFGAYIVYLRRQLSRAQVNLSE